MNLLLDMNLSPSWVETLSSAGFPTVHWSAIGLATAPDTEIMAYAKLHGHIVLTHDLDFGAILAATKGEKPSVVQLRLDYLRPEIIGEHVIAALRQTNSDLKNGALLTITSAKTRLRILPLLLHD